MRPARGRCQGRSRRGLSRRLKARVADLHLWRLGPGHLGPVVSVVTPSERCEADYRAMLARFRSLSHLTIEVRRAA
jgi:Co/Zn/Cd efflux system component